MGKARCSTTLTFIKTTPLYKATVDTAKALGISADNYAKLLQDCATMTLVRFHLTNMWQACCWHSTANPETCRAIAHLTHPDSNMEYIPYPLHYYIAGVKYPVNQNLIKSMEKRNAKLKQSASQ